MLEWLKRHVWKACDRPKRFQGSNPCLSAEIPRRIVCGGFSMKSVTKSGTIITFVSMIDYILYYLLGIAILLIRSVPVVE